MRRMIIGLTVFALAATAAGAVLAGGERCSAPGESAEKASATRSCSPMAGATSVSCENPRGKVAGRFDPQMSGVCRFGCATKLKYKSADVMAQPGAKAGKLTQCPVSGVVFAVDAGRPRVRIANDEFVTCCDKCASKLKREPRHYLKA